MRAGRYLGRAGLFAALLLLAACEFVGEAAIPALTGEGTPPRPVALGGMAGEIPMSTLGFVAPGVSLAEPSGTAVGTRLAQLRQQLRSLQQQITAKNGDIQIQRREAQTAAAAYRARVDAINAALDRGSPPGAPALRAAWTEAAAALERASEALTLLALVQRDLGTVAASSTYLQNAVAGLDEMPGAAEADRAQIRILQAETSRTGSVIDSMRLTLTQDLAQAETYMTQQRTALAALREAIAEGTAAPAPVQPAVATPGLPTPGLPPIATLVKGEPSPPPAGGGGSLVGRTDPLVLIRFDRPDVDYAAALEGAVRAALERRPSAAFDIVALAPAGADGAAAGARGLEVLGTLTRLGLPDTRLTFSTTTLDGLTADEVHVYVR